MDRGRVVDAGDWHCDDVVDVAKGDGATDDEINVSVQRLSFKSALWFSA